MKTIGRFLVLLAAVLAVAFTAVPATASAHAPAGQRVPLSSLSAIAASLCPGNTVDWKHDQPGMKWMVKWHDRPTPCWIQAALLCRNPNAKPTTKWRWGHWKHYPSGRSYIRVCPAGYSACKGNINITNQADHTPYYYTTAYLWPQCANHAPAHLARRVVHSGTGTATLSGCSRPYKWETYYYTNSAGQQVPAAAGKWTGDPDGCNFWLQTRVYASGGCPAEGHSGPVQRNFLWAVAGGTLGNVHLCFGAIHFRTNVRGSRWTSWKHVGDAPAARTLALVLPAGGHGAMIARNHR